MIYNLIFFTVLLVIVAKPIYKRHIKRKISDVCSKYKLRNQSLKPGDKVKLSVYGLRCYSPYMQNIYKEKTFVVLSINADNTVFTECGNIFSKLEIEIIN